MATGAGAGARAGASAGAGAGAGAGRGGRIKVYAVTTKSRLPSAPDIPTADEAGLPGFDVSSWHAAWGVNALSWGRKSRRASSKRRRRSIARNGPRSKSGGRLSKRRG